MFSLLTQPVLNVVPRSRLTLPGLMAALSRDEIDGFPALRPHQAPAWHMFLVQVAGLALHRAGIDDVPTNEAAWLSALRGLTPDFAGDEPWSLIVDDWTQPAFMQAPVPADIKLLNSVPTPDALDLLITAKNHDLKQAVARCANPDDWIFALISLQTGDGYGGAKNHGIARMNGGASSRPLLSLAPLPADQHKVLAPQPGSRFRRDLAVLLHSRKSELQQYQDMYAESGGLGLVWTAPWPEGDQLQLRGLDIWFVEICRRIRLQIGREGISAIKGTSKVARINAKSHNGVLGDPFAPIDKAGAKSLTLSGGDFDYRRMVDLLTGDWQRPLLGCLSELDDKSGTMALVVQALSRGNCRTEGYKSRVLPISGKVARALGSQLPELHELARAQIEEIEQFDRALAGALALAAAGGDLRKRNKDHYHSASDARSRLDQAADTLFFEHLWKRFDAKHEGSDALKAERERFAKAMFEKADSIFRAALPVVRCGSIFRPRAEARAIGAFRGALRATFPFLFDSQIETDDAV